jgi:hypothetical protein
MSHAAHELSPIRSMICAGPRRGSWCLRGAFHLARPQTVRKEIADRFGALVLARLASYIFFVV